MSTWLLEGALSVLLFAVLVPLLVDPFLGLVYRRYRYPALGPTLLAAATGLYACAPVAFTTFPPAGCPAGLLRRPRVAGLLARGAGGLDPSRP